VAARLFWNERSARLKLVMPVGATAALYCFDLTQGALRATLVRASRYANDVKTAPDAEYRLPSTDVGEHRFRFVLTPGGQELPRYATELEMQPVAVTAAPHPR